MVLPRTLSGQDRPIGPAYEQLVRLLAISAAIALSACAQQHGPGRPATATSPARTALTGTSWSLEEFRSNDDAIGVVKVSEPGSFTLALAAGGEARLRLGCNRGTGSWSATQDGGFTLGPLATTKALCPPPHLDERLARDASAIRSFRIEEDRLYLSLMADAGTYVWTRLGGER